MAQDPLFDQLSAGTLADLRRDAVQDNFFVDGAWQRLMRYYGSNDPFTGGLFMQEPFMYNRVNGGAYQPGADVQVSEGAGPGGAMGFPLPRLQGRYRSQSLPDWCSEQRSCGCCFDLRYVL